MAFIRENKWGIGLMLIGTAIGIAGAVLGKITAIIVAVLLFLLGIAVIAIPLPKQKQAEQSNSQIKTSPHIKLSAGSFPYVARGETGMGKHTKVNA